MAKGGYKMNTGLFAQVQLFGRHQKEDERLSHGQPSIHGLQGIRDNGFTRFVLHRRDVGCPENRSDVDEKGGIGHMPPETNPAIKVRGYKTSGRDHTGAITGVQSPGCEIFNEQSHERSLITYKGQVSHV